MRTILLLLTIFSINFSFANINEILKIDKLKDFTTDGCSSYPDGYIPFLTNEWLHCCVAHDITYWSGGEETLRKLADEELNSCVALATNNTHGKIMELGVTIGGHPSQLIPWRWNYGWSLSHYKYEPLVLNELMQTYKRSDSIIVELIQIKHRLDPEQKAYIIEMFYQFRDRLQVSLNANADSVSKITALDIETFLRDTTYVEEKRRADEVIDWFYKD